MNKPDIATPAGIRHLTRGRSFQYKKWDHMALKGLTYIVTDRGPQKWWRHKIGRSETWNCEKCQVAQNAAHLLQCPEIRDEKGRRWEEALTDMEWCRAVAEKLWE